MGFKERPHMTIVFKLWRDVGRLTWLLPGFDRVLECFPSTVLKKVAHHLIEVKVWPNLGSEEGAQGFATAPIVANNARTGKGGGHGE